MLESEMADLQDRMTAEATRLQAKLEAQASQVRVWLLPRTY